MLLLNFAHIVGFVKIVRWISLKFLHGFVKIDKWISQSCYMDLLKMLHGLVKVVVVVVVFLTLCQTKPS